MALRQPGSTFKLMTYLAALKLESNRQTPLTAAH